MPEYHPDLDPSAHRDAEPDTHYYPADGDSIRISISHDGDFYTVFGDLDGVAVYRGSGEFAYRYDGSRAVIDFRTWEPVEGRAPAGPDADPDLRVPAGRQPDGDDPPRRDAELRAAGGEPGAGAPAVPGGGAVPYLNTDAAWDEHERRPRPFRHAHLHKHPDDDGRVRTNAALGDAHEHSHYAAGDHHPL